MFDLLKPVNMQTAPICNSVTKYLGIVFNQKLVKNIKRHPIYYFLKIFQQSHTKSIYLVKLLKKLCMKLRSKDNIQAHGMFIF